MIPKGRVMVPGERGCLKLNPKIPMEVKEYLVEPAEEIARRLELPYLVNRPGKSPEHKVFRVAVVPAQQRGGRIEPVAILGDKPLRAAFGVFRYFLPDFHFSLGRNKPSKRR